MADYDVKLGAINRRRKLAEALMRTQGPDPNQMAGGMVVKNSLLSNLAPVFQAGMGAYAMNKADKAETALNADQNAKIGEWLMNRPGESEVQPVMPTTGFSDPARQQGYSDARAATDEVDQQKKIGWALQGQQFGGMGAAIGSRALENAMPKAADPYTLAPGAVRYDGNNRPIASAPNKPAGGGSPASVQEYEYARKNGFKGTFQEWVVAGGQSSRPSAVQEWEFYNSLPPELQSRYLEMKRNPNMQVRDVAGVPTVVAPTVSGTSTTPLSTLSQETDAAEQRKRQEASGSALGKAEGEIAGGIQTKGANAEGATGLLDEADALVGKATGSLGGRAVDAVQAAFGGSNEGSQAIARLKVIEAGLMANMPRMEGPQSNLDVQLYRDAAGQIGDPSVPPEIKKAALSTVRTIQEKYKQRAAGQPAVQPPGGIANIGSDADYDALPSGTEFVGPDGVRRRKP